MNKIVKVLNKVMPGFAAIVAALKGKPLDAITLKDVIEVAREVYGESTEYILDVITKSLSEEHPEEEECAHASESSGGVSEALGLATYL